MYVRICIEVVGAVPTLQGECLRKVQVLVQVGTKLFFMTMMDDGASSRSIFASLPEETHGGCFCLFDWDSQLTIKHHRKMKLQ